MKELKAKLTETLTDTNHQHQVSYLNFYDPNIRLCNYDVCACVFFYITCPPEGACPGSATGFGRP